MRSLKLTFLTCAIFTIVPGCAVFKTAEPRSYETVVASPQRDTEEARRRNDRAIKFFKKGDLKKARFEADQALIANVDYAPAHNTLGRILFRQGKYYLAAWEYQFAIQLQPSKPEYYNNLGLVYEAADRLPEAMSEFQTAVEMAPDDYHFVSNLARIKIRQGNVNAETAALLREVVFLDPRKEWKDWAGELLNTTHLDQAEGFRNFLPTTEHFPEGTTAWGSFDEESPVSDSAAPIALPQFEALPQQVTPTIQ